MSTPNPFNTTFDADAHAAFLDAGMASTGTYTPPAGASSTRRAFVNTASQVQGEWGQVHSPFITIDFLVADGALVKGAAFTVGSQTWRLDRIADDDARDGSLQRWVVTHG